MEKQEQKTELNPEDRQRIEQEAQKVYPVYILTNVVTQYDSNQTKRNTFIAGAEYATLYERMANETLFNKLKAERTDLNEILIKVKGELPDMFSGDASPARYYEIMELIQNSLKTK